MPSSRAMQIGMFQSINVDTIPIPGIPGRRQTLKKRLIGVSGGRTYPTAGDIKSKYMPHTATPDGRKDGGYFADSTLAPSPGADVNGPTALLNSCAKIDTLKTYNHLLNQKFTPNLLEGDMKSVFIGYLKAWREMRSAIPPHVQGRTQIERRP